MIIFSPNLVHLFVMIIFLLHIVQLVAMIIFSLYLVQLVAMIIFPVGINTIGHCLFLYFFPVIYKTQN